ncbi:MAG: hypothetical protein FJZ38_17160 [Candidatus Rokubacteria bacterium]|nr:hypothetical protein [Candidatus Rokubacteria bacterium]
MKTLIALGILVVLGTGLTAHAQTAAPSADKTPAKQATRNISGTVRSSTPETVVVTGRDKGKDAEWTFAVEPVTNIRKGSKSITAGDLRAGDAVQVRCLERDGKATALSILVKAPRKDAKKTDSK